MEFLWENIYIDRSWRFTLQVLFLVILGILVIAGLLFFVLKTQKEETLPPEVSPLSKEETEETIEKELQSLTPPEGGSINQPSEKEIETSLNL